MKTKADSDQLEEETKDTCKNDIVTKLKEADKNDKKLKTYLPDKHLPSYNIYSVILKENILKI